MKREVRRVRDMLIVATLKTGASTRATAKVFNISAPRVCQINARMKAVHDANAGIFPWS